MKLTAQPYEKKKDVRNLRAEQKCFQRAPKALFDGPQQAKSGFFENWNWLLKVRPRL